MKKLLWASLLVFALLMFTATPALAAGPLDGRIVFGESFTLKENEVLNGDLAVFGGNVTLERDSRVNGDVAVMGGTADVAGVVVGDIVVFGGSVDLESSAVIEGDLVNIGGSIDRTEGAVVRGSQVQGLRLGDGFRFPGIARVWSNGYRFDWGDWLLRFFFRLFKALVSVVLIVVIAVLVAVFLPRPLERVSQAVLIAPVHSWVVGLLTAVLGAVVGGVLIASLCLSPFGGIILLALFIASVFGWIALGLIVGLRLLEWLNVQNVTPVMGVAVGSAVLSLIAAALCLLADCCLGWPFLILLGCFGLGAVSLTRLGTQEYVPAAESPSEPQPPMLLATEEGEFAPVEQEEPVEPVEEETPPDSAGDVQE